MRVLLRRAFSGAGLLLSAAVATASPVVLDTEQKAAAGVETALFKAELMRSMNAVPDAVTNYVDFTLRTINAATTPAAVISTPGGITINCNISGTLKVKMADTLPRVLHVRWNDCTVRVFGVERRLSGPMAITLPADTFRPDKLLAVRLGNASGEFLLQHRSETPEQNSDTTEAFDIALRGDLAMGSGTSSFVMNGYYDQRSLVEFPLGTPPAFFDYKVTAERLTVVRPRTFNDAGTLDDDDTRMVRGSMSFEQTQPGFGTWTDAYRFHDYRVHRITDFDAFTQTLTVDGRIEIARGLFGGVGCSDGLYAFRTRVPMFSSLEDPTRLESGDLVVNGSVVARFYSAANTPPSLATPVNGMLVNMRVRDVGTFNYDAANWFEALQPTGQCQ